MTRRGPASGQNMIRPSAIMPRWFMKDAEVAALQAKSATASASGPSGSFGIGKGGLDARSAIAWTCVGIPNAWGVWITLSKSLVLFG